MRGLGAAGEEHFPVGLSTTGTPLGEICGLAGMREIGGGGAPAKQPLAPFFFPVKFLLGIKTFCVMAHTSETFNKV